MTLQRIAAAVACALLLVCSANAQVIGSGHVMGNGTGSAAAPTDTPLVHILNQSGSGITLSGNTDKLATMSGSITNGHCWSTDSNGNAIDAGGACSIGGGGGTVNAGLAGQPAFYNSAGNAVSGLGLGAAGLGLLSTGVGNSPVWGGPINATGMACNGSTDDTAAFQAAVTAAAGGWLILPPGVCMISSTVTSSAPIRLTGQGAGAGPGAVSTQATVIKSTSGFTTGNMFQCTLVYECDIEHLQFNAATARTSGSAIVIQSTGSSSYSAWSLIYDVAFNNQSVDVSALYQGLFTMAHTFHTGFTSTALFTEGSSTVEAGSKIFDNYIFDQTGTATDCLQIHNGYFDIYGNHILGCTIGIEMICDILDCGSPKIEHNVIENQTIKHIDIIGENGHSVSMLDIGDNEMSNVTAFAGFQVGIAIDAFIGGGSLQDVIIHDNVIRDNFIANSFCINTQQNSLPLGTEFSGIISHNVCQDLSNSHGQGVGTGSSAQGYMIVDNLFPEFVASQKYSLGSSDEILIDHNGLPFANLPAVQNGSQVFVSNGNPGSSPCTGSSTGSMAFRQGSNWKCF